ncbi:short chain dehydrogenase [Oceanicola granulosus HTCC2516]|uniref:Short chain dehydrogenase n=1 Tax=Oceanicola granulosus (strain ATCC BAA-861 / DSM 15982 / KCTC 12143 / HTCC2516) TaxID=314256 RepID=Q2CEL1_OCEGH|nr:oxidoreductase [Oceanicola granulosus]EAR51121.1 short chain dehydrogenase [Oceanicola granulosus HTCC2516]
MSDTRTALITGAAQGVGAACAERLARDGVSRMLLVDRDAATLSQTAEALRGEGVEATELVLDLQDGAGLLRELPPVLTRLGQLHIVVNAAGTTARGGVADTDPELFDFIFQINVRAPMLVMQAALPMLTGTGGTIVNITSMLAYGGPPFLATYAASKAALVALTRNTANAVKRDGVRVHAINLGWTWTPGEQRTQTEIHGLPENWRDTLGPSQPFGRLLMPEDPAELTAFLVSPGARMMTGAVIDLDQYVAGATDDNPGNA